MKNLFIALLTLFAVTVAPSLVESNKANAQLVTTLVPVAANDTLTDTDTAWVYISADASKSNTSTAVADNISRSVTARVIKVSGDSLVGTVYFQGSVDGTNWTNIDSLTIMDEADQVKTFPMRYQGDLLFRNYRMVFLSSGTQSYIPKVYLLRRSN